MLWYFIMAKIQYAEKNIHRASRILLDKMIHVIEEYEALNYLLTVRQVYYQMVTRLILANVDNMYQRTSKLLNIGRMNGEIDWDTIVDRVRKRIMPSQFWNLSDLVNAATYSYRRHRWHDQPHYVEVIVEKEALAGILEPVADKYHVSLLANKGYASASAMHDLAQRINQQDEENGKICHILYLGDHDPSGIDMVRDMNMRLADFRCSVDIQRIALTMDQIKKYEPPPNPTKMSDPRSGQYREIYGDQSWELDALDPKKLVRLLETNIKKHLDMKKYNEIIRQEEEEKTKLADAASDM